MLVEASGEMVDANSFLVPFVQAVNALVYLNLVMPTQIVQFRDICELAWSAIRLGGIPTQFPTESDLADYLLRSLAYGNLLACTYVDVAIPYFLLSGIVCVLEVDIK